MKEYFFTNDAERNLLAIKKYYDDLLKNLEEKANESDRAYGGYIRAFKGELVEYMAEQLVKVAWRDILHQSLSRITMNKQKMPVSISDKYGFLSKIDDPQVKDYLTKHKSEQIYKFGTDVQVFVDGKLVLPIECKAYAENAMIKRILFDAELMKETAGCETYYLLQLESQLGGDYSQLNEVTYGSPATNALLSHIDVKLEIITLLKGERNIEKPIHKPQYFKPLTIKQLKKAVNIFANGLEKYK